MIPIRTETSVKATPWSNYAILVANVLAYFVFDWSNSPELAAFKHDHLLLQADQPLLHEFFTYQFMHANPMHLAGNMLFLWVFGNPVCGKMGSAVYAIFYLAGGVFAGWGFAVGSTSSLLGASGAIAAITAAYLALFPRSRVTVLFFFILITTFQIPAMILIVFKVILWDNVLAPGMSDGGAVAYSAHLAGYFFGFTITMLLLWWRALPRDTFDMVALWKRWHQRQAFSAAIANPEARARAQFGTVARPVAASPQTYAAEDARIDRITNLRGQISDKLGTGDADSASAIHEQLMALDASQCLPERHQIQIARHFYQTQRYPQAAAAFERYLASYAASNDADDVRLLVGIIYARDLRQYETAEKYLSEARERTAPGPRLDQCERWLHEVRAALGKASPQDE